MDNKGAKEVCVKTTHRSREEACCTASGRTLPPMIIFKGKFNQMLLYTNSCLVRQQSLYRQNKMSLKGTEVSI